MAKGTLQEDENSLVLSFLAVRQALGILGFALPVSLLIYAGVSGNGLEPSISDFYYTAMGDVLVGILCAIGVFLITYRGYAAEKGEKLSDKWVSRIAGAAAIGVALFPMVQTGKPPCTAPECPTTGFTGHWSFLHFGSALVFFVCLALFCLVLFQRTGGTTAPDQQKLSSNKIYTRCGWVIVGALVALALVFLTYDNGDEATRKIIDESELVFWLEAIGVFAFSISWLVKGQTLRAVKALVATTAARFGSARAPKP